MIRCRSALVSLLAAACSPAWAGPITATLDVDLAKPGAMIPPTFYGLMTEEINHAYDGGLYAELIQNRTFQDKADAPAHWSAVGGATLSLDKADPVNPALPVSLRVDLGGQTAGVANGGFWGVPVKPGTTYAATFYAKAAGGFAGPLTASIVLDDGGTAVAKADTEAVTAEWKKYTLALTVAADVRPTAKAKFAITATGGGSFSLSFVSLFPPTYQETPGGLRPDLMKLMDGLKPAFIRLPGGNYLEGNDFPNRFDWTKMIGPVDARPGHRCPWGYRSSDGMGLPQMLLWCRQLNAEPVLALFAGYTLNRDHVTAGPKLQPYVDEALDEIEYVTGGPDTKWGKQRIADGLAEPFKLRYVEIGNEDWFDRSPSYDGRFTQFYDAIRAKYPDLKIIATTPVKTRTPDLYDDHSYRAPNQMVVDSDGFDPPAGGGQDRKVSYSGGRHYGQFGRGGPQIFYGEWASQEGRPTPNLRSALADAVFLMGLERNADLVPMECYAPLLVNVNAGAWQWGTNLIGYDAEGAFGSPSYHAQAMFGQNKGDVNLAAALKVDGPPPPPPPTPHGAAGVGAWHTAVEYKDFSVVAADGKPIVTDATKSADGWTVTGGKWNAQGGVLSPADPTATSWAFVGDTGAVDYTVRVKARKTGGAEGFLVLWHATSGESYNWLNVGGWDNTRTQVEAARDATREPYGPQSRFVVEPNRWYDVRVEVKGAAARCFIDDQLIMEAKEKPLAPPTRPMFASASYITPSKELVLKVVNYGADPIDTTVNLRGVGRFGKGKAIVLAGDPQAVNTVAEPDKVAPKQEPLADVGPTFRRTFPPHSLTLIRVPAEAGVTARVIDACRCGRHGRAARIGRSDESGSAFMTGVHRWLL